MQRQSIKDRLGKPVIPPANKMSLNNVKPKPQDEKPTVMEPKGLSKTVFNPDALPQPKPPGPAAHKAKSVHSQKVDIAKKKLEIQRKKQALLHEQLKQQKILIGRLEANKNMNPDDKKSILKTIKVLADSIEKLKSELLKKPAGHQGAAAQKAPAAPAPAAPVAPKVEKVEIKLDVKAETPADAPPPPSSPKEKAMAYLETKQKTQKAILDTELDIISKQNSGADTSALRQKVADLKREAAALGLLGPAGRGGFTPTSPRGRGGAGGGAYRGRGRGAYAVSHALDRRPKQLQVSRFTKQEKEEVITHLSGFGAIESIVHNDSVPSMMIDFKTRQDAEQAARDGQMFKGRSLVMEWHKSPPPTPISEPIRARRSTSLELLQAAGGEDTAAVSAALSLDDPDLEGLDEEALLGLDDEEEEDADKSWKR